MRVKCLASVDDFPEGIDWVVLAIPNAGVLATVKAGVTRGVGAVTNALGDLSQTDSEVSEVELKTVVAYRNGRPFWPPLVVRADCMET